MKIALISDIHGNLEALTSVLKHIESQRPDEIHCLGDVIGYGTDPSACLDLVDQNCKVRIMGNHEYAAAGFCHTDGYNPAAKVASEWTKQQLTDKEFSLIATFEMEHSKGDFLLVHASPFEADKWHYVLTPDAAIEAFMYLKEKICFYGHSHQPHIFTEKETGIPRSQVGHDFLPDPDGRYLINVGSVGQPRDDDPRACYVTFDNQEYEILYHRVEYDISATQSKMSRANLPEMLITRLSSGR